MNKKMEAIRQRDRIKEIISVFIKHGIKQGINNPAEIRKALEELGPTFIKIGQILSTRPDILPENYITEFGKLQDNVAPEEYDKITEIVENALNDKICNKFEKFDEKPIACASMAEVHAAVLKTGQRVVVKVQRPMAKEKMLSDIAILKRLSHFIKYTPQGNVLNPTEIVEELWQSAKKELDFNIESENIEKFSELNKYVKFITCPKVYKDYTTSDVLVMEYMDGIKIGNTEELKEQGYDLEDIACKLIQNYFKQLFEDGFFHADPHPGNILICDRKIAYIDFGMMGSLSKGMQEKFKSFLYGVATRDIELMTSTAIRIGIKKGTINSHKLYSDIEQIYNEFMEGSLYDVDLPQMMEEVFKACNKNNISMPRDITLMLKGIMTIEGVAAAIAPDLNIMSIIIPYVKSQVMKKRNFKDDFYEQLENLYMMSRSSLKIPTKFLELMNCAQAGKLKIQMEHTNLEGNINELSKMANRIVFGLIVSSLIIGSSLLVMADVGPKIYDMPAFGFIGFLGAAIMGVWLIISILKSGKM